MKAQHSPTCRTEETTHIMVLRIPAAATLAVRSFQSVKQGSLTEDLDVSIVKEVLACKVEESVTDR